MSQLLTYLVTGLALGCSYALLGAGYVVVHRVTAIVNFAQGAFPVLAGLTCAGLASSMPRAVGLVAGVAVAVAASVVIGLLAMAARTSVAALLVTLGCGIGLYSVEILLFGAAPASFAGLPGSVEVLGARVQAQYVLVTVVTLAVFGGLAWFFGRTFYGRGLTATAANPLAARLQGIGVRRAGLVAFALAGAIGGVAGLLIAPLQPVAFSADIGFAIYGFAAAVFGGLDRVGPALTGGLLLGVAQALIGGYLGAENQLAGALLIVLAVMVAQAGRRRVVVEETS